MAPAFHTVAVSLMFLLWNACRRERHGGSPLPTEEGPPPAGDQAVEDRLDCLTVLARPIPRRR